jgi:hypothetical protein
MRVRVSTNATSQANWQVGAKPTASREAVCELSMPCFAALNVDRAKMKLQSGRLREFKTLHRGRSVLSALDNLLRSGLARSGPLLYVGRLCCQGRRSGVHGLSSLAASTELEQCSLLCGSLVGVIRLDRSIRWRILLGPSGGQGGDRGACRSERLITGEDMPDGFSQLRATSTAATLLPR